MAETTKKIKIAMVPKGEWKSTTNYKYLDVVLYNGSSYVAVEDGKGQNPIDSESTQWQLLAYKGINGVDGKDGEPGATGADGKNGTNGEDAPAELVVPAVDAWLSENLSDPANPPLDASLSSASSAAQAKATGDQFKQVYDIIAPAYDESQTYNQYDFVTHTGNSGKMRLFKCNVNGVTGPWNDDEWSPYQNGVIISISKFLKELKGNISQLKIFEDAEEYHEGDYVYRAGTLYYCLKDKPARPAGETGSTWKSSDWKKIIIADELKDIQDKFNDYGYIIEDNTSLSIKSKINLDSIAYGGQTYREIFIDKNLSPWGGFDSITSFPSSEINSGIPTISDESQLHGKNLKCYGSTAQQIKSNKITFKAGDIVFFGVNINCNRFSSGSFGMVLNGGGWIAGSRVLTKTDGWISVINRKMIPINLSTYDIRLFVGSFSMQNGTEPGDCNGYIDDTVLLNLTEIFGEGKEPGKDECERLFSEYNSILSNNNKYVVSGYNNFNVNQAYWAFIEAMDKKAKEIGMQNTNVNVPGGGFFPNSGYAPRISKNGLSTSTDGISRSTVLDLLKLTTVATSYNELCKVWNRPKQTITVLRNGEKVNIDLESTVTGTYEANYFGLPFGQPANFSTEETYSTRDFVIYQNTLYYCIGSTGPGQWDSTKWASPFSDSHRHYYVLGGKTGHTPGSNEGGVANGEIANLLMCACNEDGEALAGVIGLADYTLNSEGKVSVTASANRFRAMRQLFKIGFDKLHNIENNNTVTYANYAIIWELPKFNSAMCSDGYWPKILYSQAPDGATINTEIKTASTIKTLTVVTALDYITNLQDTYTIQYCDSYITGSGKVFKEGDIVKIEDLLYTIMLPSSNQGANALAHYVGNLILQKNIQNKNGIVNNLTVYRMPSIE